MSFKQLPLTTAVLGALCAAPAFADTAQAPASAELQEVKVTADRQGAKVKTNVVTTRTKDESTETDLRGLFKDEPAINIGAGNGTSQYLYVRGMGQNSVDVKVDNAYSDSQIHYHQGRHMLDPALVKVVSVQKGAGSASAGIGQTNGAVIAKTVDAADLMKNASNPYFGGKINAGYNSNQGFNYGGAVFAQTDRYDVLFSANRVKENNYEGGKGYHNSVDGSDEVLLSALDKTGYLAKLGVNLNEDHRIVVSHLNNQHKGTRTVREEFATWTDYYSVDPKTGKKSLKTQAPAKRKMTYDQTNVEYTGKNLGFAEAVNANVYRLVQGRWSADDKGNGYAGSTKNLGETKTKIETYGANVGFDSRLHENVLLKYGVNYRHQEIKPNQIFVDGIVNQEKQDVGVYAEAIADIKDVTLTAGLRYDHFNFKAMDGKKVNDGAINPSVGVIWQATPELSFSASHNYATRSPRMHDAIMSHGARNVISIKDGTKAEQARNTEIGFNYDNGMFAADGSYFWQRISNALGTTNARDNHKDCKKGDHCEIINAGKIKNSGYELNGSFRKDGWKVRLGVAHAKPKFYGERLSANPEYAAAIGRTWTTGLSYRFAKPNLEIGVQNRFVEKVKKEDNFILVNSQTKAAEKGKDSYNVTDLTANWKPLNSDKMNVNFAVDNVFNKNYIPHAQRSDLPGAGRAYRVGVNYTF
ncbi:MAG: TonB-dependent receptor [Neisseria sp.]|nr:TonB-dependent receptor [Neisseria sp.]